MDNNFDKKYIEGIIPNNDAISSKFIQSDIENTKYIQGIVDIKAPTKSFEEKIFIILYNIDDDSDNGSQNIFKICIGRTNTYFDIKNRLVAGENIDIHKSIIITETKQTETETGEEKYYLLPLDECLTVYQFCDRVKENYSDDPFDIENYNDGAIPDYPVEEIRLTKEQEEYKAMLMASINRDKLFNELRSQESENNNI